MTSALSPDKRDKTSETSRSSTSGVTVKVALQEDLSKP